MPPCTVMQSWSILLARQITSNCPLVTSINAIRRTADLNLISHTATDCILNTSSPCSRCLHRIQMWLSFETLVLCSCRMSAITKNVSVAAESSPTVIKFHWRLATPTLQLHYPMRPSSMERIISVLTWCQISPPLPLFCSWTENLDSLHEVLHVLSKSHLASSYEDVFPVSYAP